jgi:hypothetical protein
MSNIQYTIRNIPPAVDMVVRKRAKQSGKSFNQTVVDLLSLQVIGTTEPKLNSGFDWLFGQNTLDSQFDDAISDMSKVDETLWR